MAYKMKGPSLYKSPLKQKKHPMEAIKEVDPKKVKRKSTREIYLAKLRGDYTDARGDKFKKFSKDDPTATVVSRDSKSIPEKLNK